MLELCSVSKVYSSFRVVDDVSFTVRPGEVTGYLGPNGSGKSTTLKIIVGLIEPTEGEVRFGGVPTAHDRIAFRQRFGYVPEEVQLYTHLTGLEYLQMVGMLRGISPTKLADKIDGLLQLLSLYDDRHVAMSAYSKGMRQKVLLSAALLHNPDLLILDEPFSGLDVNSALVLRDTIQQLGARGKTILLSSHELDTVERVCSRVVILSRGRVVANDSVERLRALMEVPDLESVFAQVALHQDTAAVARDVVQVVES